MAVLPPDGLVWAGPVHDEQLVMPEADLVKAVAHALVDLEVVAHVQRQDGPGSPAGEEAQGGGLVAAVATAVARAPHLKEMISLSAFLLSVR